MRVYLAAGPDGVRALRETGTLEAPGYVVTAAMRAADPKADVDDLEYEAALLAEEALREAGEPVLVVAADVPDAFEPQGDSSRIEPGPVPASAVVSFHVAEHGAPADEELLWYDATEIDDVLRYLDEGAEQ
ncbi:DUF6912 family protein [Mobilicoccus pelagius]|uniref:Uncharacterized protein n=1 Tax=Mobilicoccus pelagius NBRC 104925 TaxID=1089455 RepID=H5URX3_9MICO|nr:hypothetical protein [Mobilicoccus pelagius]GAB48481.1 hypothetical protein MOPEL_073_01220 [Mobilicoccus pelagius NBRC 104925]